MLIRSFHWWEWLAGSLIAFALAFLAFVVPNNVQPRVWYLSLIILISFAAAAIILLSVAIFRAFMP